MARTRQRPTARLWKRRWCRPLPPSSAPFATCWRSNAMPIEIVMPKLGWTMEEGVLAEWIKKDGDSVAPGDILFTVESDKALQEVEAFDAGILHIPPDSPPLGSTIPIGGLLAYLVQPGEALPSASKLSMQ